MERISRLEEAYHAALNGGWSPGFLVDWVCKGSQDPPRTENSVNIFALALPFRIWIAFTPLSLDLYLYLYSHKIVSPKDIDWFQKVRTTFIQRSVVSLEYSQMQHFAYTIFRFFFYIGAKGIKRHSILEAKTTSSDESEDTNWTRICIELNCFGIKLHVGVQGTNLQKFKHFAG